MERNFRSIWRRLYILGIGSLVLFSSCDFATKRDVGSMQMLLDECDLLLQAREFECVTVKSKQAIEKMDEIINKNPRNVDYHLLRARANLTNFIAKNALIIENSLPRPRSLVPIPDRAHYIDYDPNITCAEADVRSILDNKWTMRKEQEAAVYGTLATIYRLDMATLLQSDLYYERAIAANQSLLDDAQKRRAIDEKAQKASPTSEYLLHRQKQQLQLAQIEVNLAAEKWEHALDLLYKMAGGQDLKYFTTQFQQLETNLFNIQNKLREEFYLNAAKQSSTTKDLALVEEGRKIDSGMLRATGSRTTYESELVKTELELTCLKNNLIYRLVCYHNLSRLGEMQQVLDILKKFYPDKEQQLLDALAIK